MSEAISIGELACRRTATNLEAFLDGRAEERDGSAAYESSLVVRLAATEHPYRTRRVDLMVDAIRRVLRAHPSSSELGEDCDRTLSSTLRLFVSRPTTGEMAPSMRKRRWFSPLPSAMRQMASADFVQIERVPDEGGHQRSSEAIRGHQRQLEITQRPRGEATGRGHYGSSEAIRGHHSEATGRGHHRPSVGGQSWVIRGSSHSSPSPLHS